jgi:outer membrane protein OmpU
MTNLKKVGLTALAGSLAATTFAQAGTVSVNGTAQMEYQTRKGPEFNANNSSSKDSFTSNISVTFSGSGELDNGFGVSYSNILDASGNWSANYVAIDMGDMGTVSMGQKSDLTGLSAYQDRVPNAGEQAWDESTTSTEGKPDTAVMDMGGDQTLGYAVSANGFTLSTSMSFPADGVETSAVIAMDGLVDGLEIGAGAGNNQNADKTDDDLETYYIRYAVGPITVGAQQSTTEDDSANVDIERDAYGISLAVNENLSVSYGISDTEFNDGGPDEENEGISASYTSGGMTVGLVHNTKDNTLGVADQNNETTELKLTFAF